MSHYTNNQFDWRVYQRKSYDLIGREEAEKYKAQNRTWYEVYNKALKIGQKKYHSILRSKNPDEYDEKIAKVCQQRSYELIGQDYANRLYNKGMEWFQVYLRAMRVYEEKQLQALIDQFDKQQDNNEEDDYVEQVDDSDE